MQSKVSWAAFVVLFIQIAIAAHAATETTLYTFQGAPTDGANPVGTLVSDAEGNLYGVTSLGGNGVVCEYGTCGIVFKLSPPTQPGGAWTETVLHNFQGFTLGDGNTPFGGLNWGYGGKLYGTTGYGGTGPCSLLGTGGGCGVVFAMTPPSQKGGEWTEEVIYNFQGGETDAYYPFGALVSDQNGNLYGTSTSGGGEGSCNPFLPYCGIVFELSPPAQPGGAWTEKILHRFTGGRDGSLANGDLVMDAQGALYGTTEAGGISGCYGGGNGGCGVVYKLTPPVGGNGPWTEAILHAFSSTDPGGAGPQGGVVFDKAGNLYTTSFSAIVQLAPPKVGGSHWIQHVLFRYNDLSGAFGYATLTMDDAGNLYGADTENPGAVVRLKPPSALGGRWVYTTLFQFSGYPQAGPPSGTLLLSKGKLWGNASGGPGLNGCYPDECGTIYEISP